VKNTFKTTERHDDGIVIERHNPAYFGNRYFVHWAANDFGNWFGTKAQADQGAQALRAERYNVEAAKLDGFVEEARENLLLEIDLDRHVIEALKRFEQQVRQSAALAGRYHSRK
jgi:hypothetical protein